MRKVLACRFKRVKTAAIQVPGMIVLGRRHRKQNQLPNIFAYQIECAPVQALPFGRCTGIRTGTNPPRY
jgi:hypothetical protein